MPESYDPTGATLAATFCPVVLNDLEKIDLRAAHLATLVYLKGYSWGEAGQAVKGCCSYTPLSRQAALRIFGLACQEWRNTKGKV